MLSKCKEYFFIRFMTSRINYSLLFMLIKMNVHKFCSYKTSSFFSSLSLWNKRSSHDVFSLKTSLPNTRANDLFSKKENNQGVARFQKQIVLGSHRNNFCFQNARSRFQTLFSTHIPSPKWKKWENGLLKPLFVKKMPFIRVVRSTTMSTPCLCDACH